MSKSLGNFFTVREISEKYDLQVLRFFMLSAHYRSPLNFSADLMAASKNGLERILTAVDRLKELQGTDGAMTADETQVMAQAESLVKKYEDAMEDDFNTADAVSAIFELVKLANVNIEERQAARKAKNFARADEIRDELSARGILLEDTREGVKWKRA